MKKSNLLSAILAITLVFGIVGCGGGGGGGGDPTADLNVEHMVSVTRILTGNKGRAYLNFVTCYLLSEFVGQTLNAEGVFL